MIKFKDVQEAYDFVNFAPYGENEAYIRKETGEVLWKSAFMDDIDETEKTEARLKNGVWLPVPNRKDIEGSSEFVLGFVSGLLSEEALAGFKSGFRDGGNRFFKAYLRETGLTEKWYDFLAEHPEEILRDWLGRQKIGFDDEK